MSKKFHITIIILLITAINTGGHFDNSDKSWSTHLYKKILEAKNLPLKTISVSCPDDDIVLKACVQAYKEGYEIGINQGMEQTETEIIFNMYKNNLDLKSIAKYTNIPIEKVNDIIKNIKK